MCDEQEQDDQRCEDCGEPMRWNGYQWYCPECEPTQEDIRIERLERKFESWKQWKVDREP